MQHNWVVWRGVIYNITGRSGGGGNIQHNWAVWRGGGGIYISGGKCI